MAMNPMQRRARNSFLIGFLVALIIGAAIILLLIYRMQGIKEEFESLKAKQQQVYVASDYIQSGTEVTIDSFSYDTVQTSLSKEDLISDDTFAFVDEETGEIIEKYDSDGNPKEKKMVVKTDIPAGTIITNDMLDEVDNETTADQRLQEYNMIILPTLLKNGNYIDIRFSLPNGGDYIVVSKKKVEACTKDTVWLKMAEDEILTLSSAIVEAYTITGSKLYATTYTEAGIQEAATATYPADKAVVALIQDDPNIVEEARKALWDRYNSDIRNNYFETALSDYGEDQPSAVQAGIQEEVTKLQEAREEYVESLEGTGVIGTE